METEVSFPTEKTVLATARVYLAHDSQRPAGTGHAEEVRGQGLVNQTSAIENCETSAVGRALAMMGYEVSRSMASREEMEKVQRMTSSPKPSSGERPSAPRIPLDRAKYIATQAVDVGIAKWGKDAAFQPSPVMKAKLAELGVSKIGELNVDQAESMEQFLAAEKSS